EVADRFGLRFALPDDLHQLYLTFPLDLEKFNGDASWTLPIPARFVIDQQGVTRYAESDPDYTTRPEPEDTLAALRALTLARRARRVLEPRWPRRRIPRRDRIPSTMSSGALSPVGNASSRRVTTARVGIWSTWHPSQDCATSLPPAWPRCFLWHWRAIAWQS